MIASRSCPNRHALESKRDGFPACEKESNVAHILLSTRKLRLKKSMTSQPPNITHQKPLLLSLPVIVASPPKISISQTPRLCKKALRIFMKESHQKGRGEAASLSPQKPIYHLAALTRKNGGLASKSPLFQRRTSPPQLSHNRASKSLSPSASCTSIFISSFFSSETVFWMGAKEETPTRCFPLLFPFAF